jgi:hypothetical protein
MDESPPLSGNHCHTGNKTYLVLAPGKTVSQKVIATPSLNGMRYNLFFHLPEYGVGIGKGVAHAGGAEIGRDYRAATFGQQLEAGAMIAKLHPAIGAGSKNGITATDAANMIHMVIRSENRCRD